jgi:hypothetical protein
MLRNKLFGMFIKTLFFALSMGTSVSLAAAAKPTAPVSIEYSVPKNVQTGDTVSTTIRFVAQADLEQLEVSVAPYEGLDVVSKNEKAIFQNAKKGEKREIEVTIRLTAEIGYLSVFATTTTPRGTSTETIAIRYGTPGDATKQKLKSERLQKTQEGENLILLPGEKRPKESQ